jgi:hypothetical protein
MKIYLTAPYDPDGIEEIDTFDDPRGDVFSWKGKDGIQHTSYFWFREGATWHRTKRAALAAAKNFRKQWIVKARAERLCRNASN